MTSTKTLDEIADRLGALYQSIGRVTPSEVDQCTWAYAMDELIRITHDLETASERKKRERKGRKIERRRARYEALQTDSRG